MLSFCPRSRAHSSRHSTGGCIGMHSTASGGTRSVISPVTTMPIMIRALKAERRRGPDFSRSTAGRKMKRRVRSCRHWMSAFAKFSLVMIRKRPRISATTLSGKSSKMMSSRGCNMEPSCNSVSIPGLSTASSSAPIPSGVIIFYLRGGACTCARSGGGRVRWSRGLGFSFKPTSDPDVDLLFLFPISAAGR